MANIKKFLKITLIFAVVASTVGCAKKADKVSNSVVEGASEITATNSASDESNLLVSVEENSDAVTGRELFEKFLSNEESVIVESDRLWVEEMYADDQPFANDKNYLFSELIHRVMMEDDLSVDIKYEASGMMVGIMPSL